MSVINLDKVFQPKSVAIVGASGTKGRLGNAVLQNIIKGGFTGNIYPVNPRHSSIAGLKSYPAISDLPEVVELAVVAVPIASAPPIVETCAGTGVGGVVIISAGGKETGDEGRRIEKDIAAAAGDSGLRIVGPNCLGIICSQSRLNASFAAQMPLPGSLAFISQSGAVCGAVLDLSFREQIGFSYFISLGSMLDVDFGDVIDFLGSDPQVSSIVMYVENLTRFRNFMSAARAVSRIKPIVVLKSGRTRTGAAAAASHTGAMAGEDEIYDTAFKRCGILRVATFEELFDCADLLAKQPKPAGRSMVVVTNAGGPGVMAADAMADHGLEPAVLAPETIRRLDEVLPPHWSRANPVDMLGEASVAEYRQAVDICTADPATNGLLVMLVPQAMIDPTEVAAALVESLSNRPFPVLTSWLGGPRVVEGRELFNRHGIPTLETPERAVRAFANLWRYTRNVELLQEIPSLLPRRLEFDRQKARTLVRQGLERKSPMLTEVESKALLAAYGIPVNPTEIAFSADEAVRKAAHIGYPVVLKIYSREITHKTEAGGVELNLSGDAEVQEAFQRIMARAHGLHHAGGVVGVTIQSMLAREGTELILGIKRDRDFGPVILFGTGGIMTEVLRDRALALPPLNRLLARRLMEETRVFQLLKGFRGQKPANLEMLEEILIRLAQLATDFAEIDELDVNPLFATQTGFCAVDARARLQRSQVMAPLHLVISPYPDQYESRMTTRGLEKIFIRPIRPEDAPMMAELIESLSTRSIYHRFFTPLRRLPQSMLARFTQVDYDREIALVAFRDAEPQNLMLGVARVILERNLKTAEFSVLVGDAWQGKGIGAELLKKCLNIAKERGVETIWGLVLTENTQMLALGKKLGFGIRRVPDANTFELRIDVKNLRVL